MTFATCQTTGASHASHLGNCCPSAYSSRVWYVKKRQVWKSRSETDWPHLEIMPDFSTEKNRSILILTSTCWQEISLSNTIELTTVIPWKQKICYFKHGFLPDFENSRGSIVCLRAANPVIGQCCFYVCLLAVKLKRARTSLHIILYYYRLMDSNCPSD